MGKVLGHEIAVRSLTLERPVVSLVRGPDGNLNLPHRIHALMAHSHGDGFAVEGDAADFATIARAAPPEPHATGGEHSNDAARAAAALSRRWRWDVRKVLVVDGEVHFRDRSAGGGYVVSAAPLLAELKQAGDEVQFTVIADSVGRRGVPSAELGTLKATGCFTGVHDLTHLSEAGVRATLDVGDDLRVTIAASSLRPPAGEIAAAGRIDLATVAALLPPALPKLPTWFAPAAACRTLAGRVEVSLRATCSGRSGFQVSELLVRASDVGVGGRMRSPPGSPAAPVAAAR